EVVGEGNERGPLAAGGAVSPAEVADDGAAHFRRQKRRVEKLDGVGWGVVERLAVRGDRGDISGREVRRRERLFHCGGVRQRQGSAAACEVVQTERGASAADREDQPAQLRLVSHVPV